jgi:hypothetical protein
LEMKSLNSWIMVGLLLGGEGAVLLGP